MKDASRLFRATLTVTCNDPLATLELADAAGNAVLGSDERPLIGIGKLITPGLEPGLYRAHASSATGKSAERIVEITPGLPRMVELRVPATPEFRPAPRDHPRAPQAPPVPTAPPLPGNEVKEVLVPAGIPLPSAKSAPFDFPVVAEMAPGQLDQGAVTRSGLPDSLIEILARPFPERNGFRIVVDKGADPNSKPKGVLDSLTLRLGPLDQLSADHLRPEPGATLNRAVFIALRAPGPYRLQFEREGEAAEFALYLLDGHRCELVFSLDRRGRLRVTQFAPKANQDLSTTAEVLPKLDRLQWELDSGQAPGANARIQDLTRSGVLDPVAAAIELSLLMQEEGHEKLAQAALQVIRTFETKRLDGQHVGLPDGFVALGHAEEAANRDARQMYRKALDRGLPILQHHLEALWNGVRRLRVEHRRLPLLRAAATRRIPGLLWSAWRPERG